ncbi:hypothetical protein IGI04_037770 [Brassica rapa subsp. trilocularis]|uniref:Uncharacterized protein n=1 Tax=Brassica rapa subsp. trilocularis TaxID=1813537 RepID=A0ABQ7LK08_BRACM|nr:hypothetical protein IGI04_037770 [Brassica rapa subsp. trilocularis]
MNTVPIDRSVEKEETAKRRVVEENNHCTTARLYYHPPSDGHHHRGVTDLIGGGVTGVSGQDSKGLVGGLGAGTVASCGVKSSQVYEDARDLLLFSVV